MKLKYLGKKVHFSVEHGDDNEIGCSFMYSFDKMKYI